MTQIALLLACAGSLALNSPLDIPHPEHPRPDFERSAWVNLNGPWSFAFDPDDRGENERWFAQPAESLKRTIVVPFCWESRLSTIADTEYQGVAWYSRKVTLPKGGVWDDRDAWLVIGACDFSTKVWINDMLATEHVGGYTPFDVNLSKYAKPGEQVTVTVRVEDRSDTEQPTGKQVRWYTRNSGIWQTVYIEPRGKTHITQFRTYPNIKDGTVRYEVDTAGQTGTLQLSSPDESFKTINVPIKDTTTVATIKIEQPQLWSPDSPKLYDVVLKINADNKASDEVHTYTGIREISIAKIDGRDYQYIHLNGKPIYLLGALHQSFHPEGIYQYPDDAAIRSDYELAKDVGLNFIRIHIKTPLPRELYWADKLGVMMMQDIPNTWKHTDQARVWWQELMTAAIARDRNHPSVFSWCLFNETWGLTRDGHFEKDICEWVADMYHLAKKIDPSRLIEDNSPNRRDHVITDINSWHFYIYDFAPARDHIAEVNRETYPGGQFNYAPGYKQDDAPLINSEYGGISSGKGNQDISWHFKFLTNEMRKYDKIGGYVYTELCDIEWEHNGFVNYDRTAKEYGYDFWFPGFSLKDINNRDFIVIDSPPMIDVPMNGAVQVPVSLSHYSDLKLTKPTLHWQVRYLDRFGTWHESKVDSRSIASQPYRVTEAGTLTLPALPDAELGALNVWVESDGKPIARNYVNFRILNPRSPQREKLSDKQWALRFDLLEHVAWTFDETPVDEEHLMSGLGSGRVAYRVTLPDEIDLKGIRELRLLAEIAAKAKDEKLDWPARRKVFDYPQTDVVKWQSDVTLRINGLKINTRTLPDDPADGRGALSHANGKQGVYGYLIEEKIDGRELAQILARLGTERTLTIEWFVAPDAQHVGGFSLFGENFGAYPVDPTLFVELK